MAGAWDYGGGAFSRSRTVSAGVVRHLVDEVGRFCGVVGHLADVGRVFVEVASLCDCHDLHRSHTVNKIDETNKRLRRRVQTRQVRDAMFIMRLRRQVIIGLYRYRFFTLMHERLFHVLGRPGDNR